ncbi:MAG: T9SS type A sorting domain-containing protein [Chitinophagales bacterium]|nr:T9SS type A sorting domain-containing protein [Chitinophagales bacterium]
MKRIFTSVAATFVLFLANVISATAQWSTVGSAGLSNSVANYIATAVDGNHTPYIAYSDNSQGNKLTVEKFNGTSWVTVGGTGVSSGSAEHISIAIDGSNNIYVGYRDGASSNKATVMKYNGSSWSVIGGSGLSDGQVYYVTVAVNGSGTPYIAYQDQYRGGKATVEKYTSGNWSSVGSKGFTSGQSDYLSFDIDGSGNLYVAYRDNSLSWKARVMKYSSGSWSTLGTAGFSNGGISEIDIDVDGNNRPYVVYKDWANGNKATVESYTGGNWSVVGSSGISSNSIGTPTIETDGNNTPYIAYRDDGNNQKATVLSFNGSSWSPVTSAGFSSNTVDYTSIVIDGNNNTIYVGFKDNSVGQKATVMKHNGAAPSVTTWTGSTSTDWNTASNWSTNSVPGSSDNVKIPSGKSRYPNLASGTSSCKNIEIVSGASVIVNGGTLRIAGSISNSGTFNAENGTIVLNGTSAQTIPSGAFSNKTIKNLELNNGSGCSLADTIKITDTYTPTSGTLTTNDKFVLKSSPTGTARVAQGYYGGNYISGKTTVEQYIPGKRAYRFMSHPFGTPIALSQLTDDIDITGNGGTTNGFTAVQVNAPSAYYFDASTADNSTYGNNPGWKDFPSAIPAYWDAYEMARIFIRGSKGQGLTSAAYTPDSVTIDMTGDLITGDRLIGLDKGNNSEFVICGNPYASPVNMRTLTRTDLYSSFVVWDPNMGTKGGYSAYSFYYNYYLPAYSGFVAKVYSWKSKGFVNFQESDKTSATPAALFKHTANDPYMVELKIEDSTTFWDRLTLSFDSTGMAVEDSLDMVKLHNPDVDFYTLSDDNVLLSIDTRPFEDNKVIRLGMDPGMTDHSFALKVPQFNIPVGTKLYLYDKFTGKTEELKEGFEYWFDVTSDTNSYGADRFSINMKGIPDDVSVVKNAASGRMQLIPNPAHGTVKVAFDQLKGTAVVKVADMSGRVVYVQSVNAAVGSVVVPLYNLPDGVYMVELESDNTHMVEKLVKQ